MTTVDFITELFCRIDYGRIIGAIHPLFTLT